MLSMYSKLYCIIWYFACLHKYPKWIVLSSYAMISIELCILCSIGNRFGSVRLVLGGCQWPALGRNLHNFIWIVALINCPRFPLSSILSLSVSVLLFYRLHIVMTFKTFVLFLYVPVFLPPLLLYRSPSLPPSTGSHALSCIWLFIDKVISLWLWVSVTLRFRFASILFHFFSLSLSSMFFFVLLPLLLCGLAHTALPLSTIPWQKGSIFVSFGEHFYLLLRLCHGIDNRRSELKPHVLSRLHSREFPIDT